MRTYTAKQVNIHEAKSSLSRLLVRVVKGEEVIIAKGNRPIARLVPAFGVKRRVAGSAKGKLVVKRGIEKPLPLSLIKAFEK